VKRKLLNGCALSLAIACGNSLVFGQAPNYIKQPLYSGTGFAPQQYVAYAPAVQANPYASYFQIPGEQAPISPPVLNPGQLIPQAGHQHVQPLTIPQGNQNQGIVSPLPATEPQSQYYQQQPQYSQQQQPQYYQPNSAQLVPQSSNAVGTVVPVI